MLLHYIGKVKIRNLALYMHVKHVSDVTFYHLSNRMCKISTFFGLFTVLNRLKALQLSKEGL